MQYCCYLSLEAGERSASMRAVNDATLAKGHCASLLEQLQTMAGALLPWLEFCLTDASCRDALPCSEACPTLASASPACGSPGEPSGDTALADDHLW